jgi:ABC-type polysaccharide/polyol phosphate transport system ATPase subunit
MAGSVAISAHEVSKTYRLWSHPSARLQSPGLAGAARLFPAGSGVAHGLQRRAAAGYRDFHAVHPLSFEIRRGEAVGIIGRNGSGKSTLLQLIAGILPPSSGRIEARGRISALLELGSGFNPEFTGRENVYLNGSILGLGTKEMDALIEPIIAFADIGEFIDEPVKTYSSGMMMRLAFAVAVSVQPDILIVDEALSVGDVFFTQKCFQRIREILAAGATLIFVSHDTAAVQNLCNRVLLLHHGKLIFDGAPEDGVARYFSLHESRSEQGGAVPGSHPAVSSAARTKLVADNLLPRARSRHGDRKLEIVAAAVLDHTGEPAAEFETMHRVCIRMLLKAHGDIHRPSIGIQVVDRMANLVFSAGTAQLHFALPALKPDEEVMLDFRLTLSVYPGEYTLGLDAAEYDADNPNVGTFFDRVGGLGPITVTPRRSSTIAPFYGIAHLPMEIAYA